MTPKKMTGAEIRQTFIDFFVEHGNIHKRKKSIAVTARPKRARLVVQHTQPSCTNLTASEIAGTAPNARIAPTAKIR